MCRIQNFSRHVMRNIACWIDRNGTVTVEKKRPQWNQMHTFVIDLFNHGQLRGSLSDSSSCSLTSLPSHLISSTCLFSSFLKWSIWHWCSRHHSSVLKQSMILEPKKENQEHDEWVPYQWWASQASALTWTKWISSSHPWPRPKFCMRHQLVCRSQEGQRKSDMIENNRFEQIMCRGVSCFQSCGLFTNPPVLCFDLIEAHFDFPACRHGDEYI